jgi:hypothetical protein
MAEMAKNKLSETWLSADEIKEVEDIIRDVEANVVTEVGKSQIETMKAAFNILKNNNITIGTFLNEKGAEVQAVDPQVLASTLTTLKQPMQAIVISDEAKDTKKRELFLDDARRVATIAAKIKESYTKAAKLAREQYNIDRNIEQKPWTAIDARWSNEGRITAAFNNLNGIKNVLDIGDEEKSKYSATIKEIENILVQLRQIELYTPSEFFIEDKSSMTMDPRVLEVYQSINKLPALIDKLLTETKSSDKLATANNRKNYYTYAEYLYNLQSELRSQFANGVDAARQANISKGFNNQESSRATVMTDQSKLGQPDVNAVVPDANLALLINLLNKEKESLNKHDQLAIGNLVGNLQKLLQQPASNARDVAVHKEFMKTYIVEAYLNERTKSLGFVKKGPLSKALENVIDTFENVHRNKRLFAGVENPKSTNLLESRLMSSVMSTSDVKNLHDAKKELTEMIFARAMAEGVTNKDQRIFVNAQKAIIAMEDDQQVSTRHWNELVKVKGLPGVLELSLDVNDKSRKENKLIANFNNQISGNPTIKNAILTAYYPEILMTLFSEKPRIVGGGSSLSLLAEKKVELSKTDNEVIDKFVSDIKDIRANSKDLNADIYKRVMEEYIKLYISERSRDGALTVKTPLLKYFEITLNNFTNRTGNEMFMNIHEKELHDKILKSTERSDTPADLVRSLAQMVFEHTVARVLTVPSASFETAFANSMKVIERLGPVGKAQWNKSRAQLGDNFKAMDFSVNEKMGENDARKIYKELRNVLLDDNNNKIIAAYVNGKNRAAGKAPEVKPGLSIKISDDSRISLNDASPPSPTSKQSSEPNTPTLEAPPLLSTYTRRPSS